MNTILRLAKGLIPHIVYMTVLPAFFIAFTLLYNPFGILQDYSFGSLDYGFHIMMLTCIILVTLIVTRIVFYFMEKKYEFKWWQYVLWCAGEAFIASCFIALYTQLFKKSGGGYFPVLATSMKYVFLTLVYPYVFLVMQQIISNKDQDILAKDSSDNSLVKFYDEHKRLKLTIAPSSILFVNAESNYIKIHYIDNGKIKEFLLRNSMKSVEASTAGHGLVRCHRSYFVNPDHVKVLRKDKEGVIYAEMDTEGISGVPVSKQYYGIVSDLL